MNDLREEFLVNVSKKIRSRKDLILNLIVFNSALKCIINQKNPILHVNIPWSLSEIRFGQSISHVYFVKKYIFFCSSKTSVMALGLFVQWPIV